MKLRGKLTLLVNVDFHKRDFARDRVGGGELFVDGGNGFAGGAPGGEEVGDEVGVAVEESAEVEGGADFVRHGDVVGCDLEIEVGGVVCGGVGSGDCSVAR